MARRALTQEEKTQKQKKEALERDYKETIDRLKFCPEPTYLFNIGDDVCIGNLKNVKIVESHENGKFYKIRYSIIHNNYGHPYQEDGLERYCYWHKLRPVNKTTESFIRNDDIRLTFSTTSIESILSKAYFFGLDMNPDYQRDYVWNEQDKVALIDSIFSNVDIGKFCFATKENSQHLYEVVDGKQRIRAILDFYENRFPYKGKFFNDLSKKDQNHFCDRTISSATITNASRKEILRYFIVLNKTGRQMEVSQLEKVENIFNSL